MSSLTPDDLPFFMAAAGLLHDVGKIGEPARLELSQEHQRLEGQICPTGRDGRGTHRHVLYTAAMMDRMTSDWGGLDRALLFRVACYHHRPSSGEVLEHLLTHADRLASGHDRRTSPDADISEQITGLRSPLAGFFEGVTDASARLTMPVGVAGYDEASFLPGPKREMGEYRDMCLDLAERVIAAIPPTLGSPAWAVECLDAVMRDAASGVPASRSRTEVPDTSLYDHSRVVAAFASTLGALHAAAPFPDENAIAGRYRLVQLRLKGIQDFIFRRVVGEGGTGAAERGRAKSLRARSFYVAVLSRACARVLLDACGLPSVNLVRDAGGAAVLLLPDGAAHAARLEAGLDRLRRWLIDVLAGTIRLEVGEVAGLGDADFTAARFPSTVRRLEEATNAARGRFMAAAFRADGGWSEDGWVGSTPGLPVDGGRIGRALIDLGRRLPTIRAVELADDDADGLPLPGGSLRIIDGEPGGPGRYAVSLAGASMKPAIAAAATIPRANTKDVEQHEKAHPDDDEPLRDGQPLTFELIAARSTDDHGRPIHHPMLGALKADVDRLGYLFAYGLEGPGQGQPSRASFGRLAAAGRTLDAFFKGFLDARLRDEFRNVYTVFAGGDDLFLVGPWFDIVRLAGRVRAWFGRHVCGHPKVTISAGIAFTKPHVPVRVIAAAADAALEHAKEHRDRISVLSASLTWDEFDEAMRLHERLHATFAPSEVDRGFLRRLLGHATAGADAMRLGAVGRPIPLRILKWRSQLRYDFTRTAARGKDNPVQALEDIVVSLEPGGVEPLRVACMLTLYRLRGEPK